MIPKAFENYLYSENDIMHNVYETPKVNLYISISEAKKDVLVFRDIIQYAYSGRQYWEKQGASLCKLFSILEQKLGKYKEEIFSVYEISNLYIKCLKEMNIIDPACGSGGMFVQTAHYIEHHKAEGKQMNLRAYGVEKTGATVKLAKMNLVLNNVRETITEANSYYRDPYDSFGNFDYVMANPPFNVDEVELDGVKDQPRFNTYGIPQNKTKNKKKDAKETVPNAYYLWINQFATALKENGRAALVWRTPHPMLVTAKRIFV